MMTDDDEPAVLSANAFAALAEFVAERDAHQFKFNKLKAQAEQDVQFSMDAFAEDWNKSQFWYSDETAGLLADQLLRGAFPNSSIGVISAPSVFVALRNKLVSTFMLPCSAQGRFAKESYLMGHANRHLDVAPGADNQRDIPLDERPRVVLLEHDDRFGVFPEFVYYDYQQPLKLPVYHKIWLSHFTCTFKLTNQPDNMKGSLDSIICDPPFLNEDCQTKAALTVRWLLKSDNSATPLPRVIVCTGERMEHVVTKLYRPLSVQTTDYEPVHAGGLSNEFCCYANFMCSAWTWKA